MDAMKNKALPPLNWLRSFEAAARLLSFTQAANELHMTQGAISQQIKSLEAQLNTPLFKRQARSIELTEEGLAYLPIVHGAIQKLMIATNEIFGEGHRKQVKIRGSMAFFSYWLNARRLTSFQAEHPDINLQLNTDIWLRQEEMAGDLEIRWGKGQWTGVKVERLSRDTLFPVCSPALLARQPLRQVDDLRHHELLHVMGYEEGWGEWLQFAEATRVNPSEGMQFDTYACVLHLVESGFGVALGRLSLVEDQLRDGTLIAPFGQRLPSSEDFYLVYPQEGFSNPYARRFADWLLRNTSGRSLPP